MAWKAQCRFHMHCGLYAVDFEPIYHVNILIEKVAGDLFTPSVYSLLKVLERERERE